MNPLRCLLALAFLSAVTASFGARKKPLLSPSMSKQLAVRGGAGPLNPDEVTKLAVGILLAQGTVATLAPKPSFESYGGEPTPTSILCARRTGVAVLDIGVLAFGLLYNGWSTNTAAAISSLIWVAEFTGSMLNDEASKIGFSNNNIVVWLALNLIAAYIYLTNVDCANTFMKAFSIFTFVTCAPIMFSPASGFKAYGHDIANIVDIDLLANKVTCTWVTAIAVFTGSIAYGTSPTKALGYAFIPHLVELISILFVTNETDKLSLPKAPTFAWLLLDAIVVATLAID